MPQIAQLTADNWYLASQLFWLLVVFAGIYAVIGRGMLPKIEATVDARDRKVADRRADTAFLAALIAHFGEEPFVRGNLDAGRLSWLLGREVIAVGKLNPTDYEQLLRVDMKRAEAGFPELFAADAPEFDWDDDDWDDEDFDEDEGGG